MENGRRSFEELRKTEDVCTYSPKFRMCFFVFGSRLYGVAELATQNTCYGTWKTPKIEPNTIFYDGRKYQRLCGNVIDAT